MGQCHNSCSKSSSRRVNATKLSPSSIIISNNNLKESSLDSTNEINKCEVTEAKCNTHDTNVCTYLCQPGDDLGGGDCILLPDLSRQCHGNLSIIAIIVN